MVIDDFHIISVRTVPPETHSVLIVDSDTILPLAVPFERFELIAGQRQVAQVAARFNWNNFRIAVLSIDWNLFEDCCRKIFSVSTSRNEPIITLLYIGKR